MSTFAPDCSRDRRFWDDGVWDDMRDLSKRADPLRIDGAVGA